MKFDCTLCSYVDMDTDHHQFQACPTFAGVHGHASARGSGRGDWGLLLHAPICGIRVTSGGGGQQQTSDIARNCKVTTVCDNSQCHFLSMHHLILTTVYFLYALILLMAKIPKTIT